MPFFQEEKNLFFPKSFVNRTSTFSPLSGRVHSILNLQQCLDLGGLILPVSPKITWKLRVDSNSAQVLCKYQRESGWKDTFTSFIGRMDPASHHAPCPYLNNSPVNLKIEESAFVTDLKTDSSVLRTDTNQGHDPVLF